MKVTKDTIIGELLANKPESIGTLMSFGMGCVMCPASQMESLEEAALVHGLNVDLLVEALNTQEQPE
ncbi:MULTISPECIES: DUF1858 domain-containing protein [Peptoniphilus]|uniref:DUF1858 domain-containing protein n=1 Tax=Peptoniphilus TaxID=162289 RepID=UPI0001DA99B0|nr:MULTISPECIES: DUF1858 domain-containing protein [Peptoniphilus]EFI41738.1 hydrid cluster protein-associated redox disulfide domain protein [Peptoniphilus sp. oral taxon 386 str. F0131]